MSQPLISVVVPVYNEETNIEPFYTAFSAAVAGLAADFELLFVDDGSRDRSFALIAELARRDARVRALRLSRNFGSHPAQSAGLRHARGAAAVLLSVDLQDPPSLIGQFMEEWQRGYHVVWGVRETRDDPWSKQLLARAFYALIRRIAIPDFPREGMDCGLLDRRVIDVFNRFEEANRILAPLLVWAGFRQTAIPYHRAARHSGESKWPLMKRIKSALDIIVSFSFFPIRFISYLGLAVSGLSFLYAAYLIVRRIVWGLGAAGWPSVMVAILLLGGVQLIMLGMLGEYIWRTAEQTRARPLYIVMEQVGFEDEQTQGAADPALHR